MAPIALVAAMGATAADAVTVELASVTGTFQNALWDVDYHNVKDWTYDQLAADPRQLGEQFIRDEGDELWWGSTHTNWDNYGPLSPDQQALQSGYTFEGVQDFSSTDGRFVFGLAKHHNGIMWSNSASLSSVEFKLDINGTIDGQGFSLSALFDLVHDETINPSNPCAAGGEPPCGDLVLIGGEVASSNAVEIDGIEYVLVLEGLVDDIDGPALTQFFTGEGLESWAMLRARIDAREVPPVPLPAAGWLLIAGIGGLLAVARRRA